MAPPAEKKQKTEEAAAEAKPEETPKAEEKKLLEPPKELEADAPACTKPKVKDAPAFLTQDTTLNVLQSSDSTNVLMSLTDGGIQHFLAGARANLGISKGRYMFEAKIVQVVNTADVQNNAHSKGQPSLVRLGFSTTGSDLMLGESTDSICFDSLGSNVHNKTKSKGGSWFQSGNVMGVLLNLDKDSPNFNTVSLFKDGLRVAQPVALPESLKGKALFPHINYKHASVHVNFGPNIAKPLPFKCRMVGAATATDVTVTKAELPADGKYEVLFPVSMPDEGSFDWLDMFLEKSKNYIEISDRKILDWAEKSAIWKKAGYSSKGCNDKPDMAFSTKELDDGSVRRALFTIAALQKRNYVIMEVKGNLIKEERQQILAKFSPAHFKKVANVLVGDPNLEFKKRTQTLTLAEKQAASDKAFTIKKLEEKKKKEFEKRQKAHAKAKRAEERKKKKAIAEAKKAAAAKAKEVAEAKAKAAAEAGKKEGEENKEEEKKEEKKEEEKKEEEKEAEVVESESEDEVEEVEQPDNEKPPKVDLTTEEKAATFRKLATPDLEAKTFSKSFANFSLPESEEGFDEVRFEWSKTPKKAKDFVTEWKLNRKLITRVEELVPSPWFGVQFRAWQTTLGAWHSKQGDYKRAVQKKEQAKAAKEAKKARDKAAKEAAEKKAQEDKEKAAKAKEDKKDGDKEEKKEEEKKEEEAKPMEVEEEKEEEEVVVDFEGTDIFGVDDVNDLGGGMPLCKEFQHEDWTMLALRFELSLLAHAFVKDVKDEERLGMPVDHVGFYYEKYFKKALNLKEYGVDSFAALIELVNDTLHVTEKSVVLPVLGSEMENQQIYVQITEEARRDRLLRIDLGEENAALKIPRPQSEWQWKKGGNQQRDQNWGGGGGSSWSGGGGGGGGNWKSQGKGEQPGWASQPSSKGSYGNRGGDSSGSKSAESYGSKGGDSYGSKGGGSYGKSSDKGSSNKGGSSGYQPYGKGGGKSSEGGGGWQDRSQGKGGSGKWGGGGNKY